MNTRLIKSRATGNIVVAKMCGTTCQSIELQGFMNSFIVESAAVGYNNKGSRPSRSGETFLDNPSNTIFIEPGICSVSASCACTCIEIVVKIMLARLASIELVLSDLAQARELMLSPCKS